MELGLSYRCFGTAQHEAEQEGEPAAQCCHILRVLCLWGPGPSEQLSTNSVSEAKARGVTAGSIRPMQRPVCLLGLLGSTSA